MLTDSERFAFKTFRIHAFATSGNAYDGVQTDDRIATGDLLLVLDKAIVGIAMTWPFAVTTEAGNLHQIAGKTGETGEHLATSLGVEAAAIATAIALARQLGFAIDPALDELFPTSHAN